MTFNPDLIQEGDERTETLNGKGAMFLIEDKITQQFLAQVTNKKMVEIGIAYGNVLLESLRRGCAHYTAIDIEQQHLSIAAANIQKEIPHEIINQKVRFYPGSYPEAIQLDTEQYDAILASRVVHFFTPEQFEKALIDFYRILKPGGKVYVLTGSPYVKLYQSFIPIYEQRKKDGIKYPGYVDSLLSYVDPQVSDEVRKKYISTGSFMFFDAECLRQQFEEVGFMVEQCLELPLPYLSTIWQYDGRENVGLIAYKPR